MAEPHDRDALVELMGRYANMSDTKNWDDLPRSVFCDEFVADFSAFGAPAATVNRDQWAQQSRAAFSGWTATHHANVAVRGHDGRTRTVSGLSAPGRRAMNRRGPQPAS